MIVLDETSQLNVAIKASLIRRSGNHQTTSQRGRESRTHRVNIERNRHTNRLGDPIECNLLEASMMDGADNHVQTYQPSTMGTHLSYLSGTSFWTIGARYRLTGCLMNSAIANAREIARANSMVKTAATASHTL